MTRSSPVRYRDVYETTAMRRSLVVPTISIVTIWAVLATAGWVLRLRPLASQWGSVADAVAAVGTVGALIAATIAARAAQGQLRATRRQVEYQAEQLAKMDERSRREQAEKVSAWVHYDIPYGGGDEWIDPRMVDHGEAAILNNASESPVYDVAVMVSPTHRFTMFYSDLPPGRMEADDVTLPLKEYYAMDPYAGPYRLAIIFTDRAGVRWFRDFQGQLTQRPERFRQQDAWPEVEVGPESRRLRPGSTDVVWAPGARHL